MTRINELTPTRMTAARRRALGLLSALAITAGAVAAPLAGTAHAGGLNGGVVLRSENGSADYSTAGGLNGGVVGSRAGSTGFTTAGSKLGAGTD